MPKPPKTDPYNGFKDDRERRLALNTRARSNAVAAGATAMAVFTTHIDWMERLRWLMSLFH